jgi:uncharacterized alpha-E superfamily protein
LLTESAPTYWCGDPQSLEYVLGNLDSLVVKPAFATSKRSREFASRMGVKDRAELAARIRATPEAYAAQEYVPLSTTPVRSGNHIVPRRLVVRAFAVGSGDNYRVMPGGLARVSPSRASRNVSMVSGGLSKDLWVIGPSQEPPVSLLTTNRTPIDVSRATFDLPSRVGENLYWLGRYAERVEATARLLRGATALLSVESTRRTDAALRGARAVLANLGHISEKGSQGDLRERLEKAVYESEDRKGFGWQVHQLRHVAWMLRDRLSGDAWRTISRLESEYVEACAERKDLEDLLDSVVMTLAAFSGAAMEAMTRGHGWRLLDIGRRLERALQVCGLLRASLVETAVDERARLELLLEAADSSITYRSRYLTSLQADLVIDLLLIDDANPRAIVYQLLRLKEHIASLPAGPSTVRKSPEARLVTDAIAAIELAQLDEISAVVKGRRESLEDLVSRIEEDLERLSDALTQDYLTHAKPFRHFAVQ